MSDAVAFVLLSLLCTTCLAYYRVDQTSGHFVDSSGRERLFHGVNVVYKLPPYFPPATTFDPQRSFGEKDVDFLFQHGFTAVRLYVSWHGAEPVRGQYNATYLDAIEALVELLGSKGIVSILDCHQDVMSPLFCGEGFPDHGVVYSNDSDTLLDFPVPVPSLTPYKVDQLTGYPSRNDCNSHPFYLYYMSYASCKAWQSFYDNDEGVRDRFLLFWKEVARRFQSNPNVLGYELLNEPWTGDLYADPSLIEPCEKRKILLFSGGLFSSFFLARLDQKYLAPLYRDLHAAIRSHDTNHIIFFEAVSDFLSDFSLGKLTAAGFTEGPGGWEYNDRYSTHKKRKLGENVFFVRQVFSYHVYCPLMDSHGQPRSSVLCDLTDEVLIKGRQADVKKMNMSGSFVTEWGAFDNFASDSVAARNGQKFLDQLDEQLLSWAYWQFKGYDDITTQTVGNEGFWDSAGQLQEPKVKMLSRTYAPMIAGQYINMSFEAASGWFSVSYRASNVTEEPTQIFINQKLYYPNGYTTTSSPPDAVTFSFEPPFIIAHHSSSVEHGQVLTIFVTAK
ncbi:endoglycoceramidase-like isoform X4 [Oscarella lobularis]|uniref:endoglycoceramidase-like isoform X4 n=1 Tax=Oscarella lobularis TaxID=121494 RepID=UPI003313BCB5